MIVICLEWSFFGLADISSKGEIYQLRINKIEFTKKVPSDRVKHVIDQEKIECSKTSIETMFDGIQEKKPHTLEELYKEYRYAGKTAVNIFECTDFPEGLKVKEGFLVHLKRKLNITSALIGNELKPEITTVPQINLIEDLGEAVLLQWVSGEKKIGYDGYEVVERIVPSFEYMMIRFGDPIFIELRSGFSTHKKYKEALKSLLSTSADNIPNIDWLPVTKVTEAEAEKISEILEAGLLESEVIGEGCIGKLAVSAAPGIDDLKKQEQYKSMVAGREYLAQVFHVDYQEVDTGYSTKVKFRINHKGGFEFKSKVSERIIRRILDVFVEVRYRKESEQGNNEAVS